MAFVLTGVPLSFKDLQQIIGFKLLLEIDEEILNKYSVNIAAVLPENSTAVQSYMAANAVGLGEELPEEIIKLALVLQVNNLLMSNNPAVQKTTLNRVISFYNRDVFPVVLSNSTLKSQAAQLSLPYIGLGKVRYQGYELQAENVLEIFSWQPLALFKEEAALLLEPNIFNQAQTAYFLIQLDILLPWLTYLAEIMQMLSPENPEILVEKLTDLKGKIKKAKTTWEDYIFNSIENIEPEIDIEILISLNLFLKELAKHTTAIFEHLAETSEPPATSSFVQAASLSALLMEQYPVDFSKNSLSLESSSQLLKLTEQLAGLCFWGISQVGKVFNLATDNLTLSAYYHSKLFVPKELVTVQLDKTINFIKTSTPIAQT